MTPSIRVTLEGMKEFQQELYQLGQKDAALAEVRAINRTAQTTQTRSMKLAAEDTGLPLKEVRKSFTRTKATIPRREATLIVTGRRIPRYAFDASPKVPGKRRAGGVSYRGEGGQRIVVPDAFIARMPSGHIGVYKRKAGATSRRKGAGWTTLPIFELMGPSLPHVIRNKRIFETQLANIEAVLRKNLEHEIAYRASQRGLTLERVTAPLGDVSPEAAA
jgi:hypothetical protein